MATATLVKIAGRIILEDGSDTQGNLKTKTMSIADLNEEYFTTSSANAINALYAIVTALEPCLAKTIYSVQTVATNRISAS